MAQTRDSTAPFERPAKPLRLGQAIELGEAAQLARSLALGADPNAKARGGLSLLALACRLKQTESALVLIAAGANPDGLPSDEEDGNQPIRLACARNLPSVVLALAQAGASAVFDSSLDQPLLSEWQQHPDCIAALIEGGADVNALSFLGDTPLMAACVPSLGARGEQSLRSAALLIQAGARLDTVNRHGKTALDLSAAWLHERACALLRSALERQALVGVTEQPSDTPPSSASSAKARL